jgi:hypothetical protein
MPSSAVAGMVFVRSQELYQTGKPMTEIELNEKIESLLTESAPRQPSRRTGSAYRREMRIRKNDALMRIVTRSMCLMPAISITALMVTRCSIPGSTSSIPRTVIASGG